MLPLLLRACQALVLLLLLGACQRATYSFQPSGTVPATLLAAPAAQLAAPAGDTLLVGEVPARALPARLLHLRRPHHPRATATLRTAAPAHPQLWQVLAAVHATKSIARQQPLPAGGPLRYRSRGIALLLAAVPLLLSLPIGLHYFYLGYVGRGLLTLAVAAVAAVLIALGAVGAFLTLFAASSGALTLFTIGAVLFSILYLVQLIDTVRIALGDLRPKNGEYYPRFFQSRPAATTAPPAR